MSLSQTFPTESTTTVSFRTSLKKWIEIIFPSSSSSSPSLLVSSSEQSLIYILLFHSLLKSGDQSITRTRFQDFFSLFEKDVKSSSIEDLIRTFVNEVTVQGKDEPRTDTQPTPASYTGYDCPPEGETRSSSHARRPFRIEPWFSPFQDSKESDAKVQNPDVFVLRPSDKKCLSLAYYDSRKGRIKKLMIYKTQQGWWASPNAPNQLEWDSVSNLTVILQFETLVPIRAFPRGTKAEIMKMLDLSSSSFVVLLETSSSFHRWKEAPSDLTNIKERVIHVFKSDDIGEGGVVPQKLWHFLGPTPTLRDMVSLLNEKGVISLRSIQEEKSYFDPENHSRCPLCQASYVQENLRSSSQMPLSYPPSKDPASAPTLPLDLQAVRASPSLGPSSSPPLSSSSTSPISLELFNLLKSNQFRQPRPQPQPQPHSRPSFPEQPKQPTHSPTYLEGRISYTESGQPFSRPWASYPEAQAQEQSQPLPPPRSRPSSVEARISYVESEQPLNRPLATPWEHEARTSYTKPEPVSSSTPREYQRSSPEAPHHSQSPFGRPLSVESWTSAESEQSFGRPSSNLWEYQRSSPEAPHHSPPLQPPLSRPLSTESWTSEQSLGRPSPTSWHQRSSPEAHPLDRPLSVESHTSYTDSGPLSRPSPTSWEYQRHYPEPPPQQSQPLAPPLDRPLSVEARISYVGSEQPLDRPWEHQTSYSGAQSQPEAQPRGQSQTFPPPLGRSLSVEKARTSYPESERPSSSWTQTSSTKAQSQPLAPRGSSWEHPVSYTESPQIQTQQPQQSPLSISSSISSKASPPQPQLQPQPPQPRPQLPQRQSPLDTSWDSRTTSGELPSESLSPSSASSFSQRDSSVDILPFSSSSSNFSASSSYRPILTSLPMSPELFRELFQQQQKQQKQPPPSQSLTLPFDTRIPGSFSSSTPEYQKISPSDIPPSFSLSSSSSYASSDLSTASSSSPSSYPFSSFSGGQLQQFHRRSFDICDLKDLVPAQVPPNLSRANSIPNSHSAPLSIWPTPPSPVSHPQSPAISQEKIAHDEKHQHDQSEIAEAQDVSPSASPGIEGKVVKDRYKVLAALKVRVYKVQDIKTQKICVLKMLQLGEAGLKTKFEYEKLIKLNQSPHICEIVSAFFDQGTDGLTRTEFLCVVLKFYEHGDLKQRINARAEKKSLTNDPKTDEQLIKRWILQLTKGLSLIHQKGIIHRDLKPANLFLDSDDSLIIGDFGVATSKTDPSTLIGTVGYVAPELYTGRYTKSADLFSVGCVMLDLLTLNPVGCKLPLGTRLEAIPSHYSPKWKEIVCGLLQEGAQRWNMEKLMEEVQGL